MDTSKVWYVTGVSRGFGLSLEVDLTDPASIHASIEKTVARFGRIDVVVNYAGFK